MSVIAATTLREKTSALDVPVETLRQGASKAWAAFQNLTTFSTHDSFNVASITDVGVGDATLNFTNLMANGDFAHSTTSNGGSFASLSSRSTTTLRCVTMNDTAVAVDRSFIAALAFGDHV
jgi:hypothetical protein